MLDDCVLVILQQVGDYPSLLEGESHGILLFYNYRTQFLKNLIITKKCSEKYGTPAQVKFSTIPHEQPE